MRLDDLNRIDAGAAARQLRQCCGSTAWAAQMAASRPFGDLGEMLQAADRVFATLERADWLEAFAAHPAIGAGGAGGAAAEATADWSAHEQRLVAHATDETRRRLAGLNRAYEARFGYIFIVCATGKTGGEMLALLERRLDNDPDTELQIAATEQTKITHLRLHKLVDRRRDDDR